MVIDGKEKEKTLFQMVKETLPKGKPNNSVIAFHDNSSAIRGYDCDALRPTSFDKGGRITVAKQTLHPILTAETHNFPSGVAPFPGAETGTGGRLRDVMATGRGAYPVAGVSSYCVGNLQIPGYELPWEDKSFKYPSNLGEDMIPGACMVILVRRKSLFDSISKEVQETSDSLERIASPK